MPEKTVQNRLIVSFERFRDHRAIEYGENIITYDEIDVRSNCIADWIVNKGIGKETFIGILVEDKVMSILAVLGILRAKCVFVSLDSSHPNDRIENMIHSTDIKFVIIDEVNIQRLSKDNLADNHEVEFIPLTDLFSNSDLSLASTRPKLEYDPADKVYIYFTSGTTGTPRAIIGKNKSLMHFIDWEIDTFSVIEDFKFSQFSNPGFDAYLRDIFVPLCSGGTICIPPENDKLLDAPELKNWLEKSKVRLIHCVPSLFRLFNENGLAKDDFKDLQYILLSGEKIEPLDLKNWFDIFGERIKLVNLWGTSETTMAKTCYFIQKSDVNRERIPVGKPIRGARVIVLDEGLNICEEQVIGEMYIRTPFRTYGYYNDVELNRRRFIPNPFSNDPNDLLHKTGDLGRLLPDGNFDVLGRVDRQVKIRGVRVELEEIESILTNHPSAKEAVVLKIDSTPGNDYLCAFVTENRQDGVDEVTFIDNIRKYSSRKLPEIFVPAKIIKIKEIPRTPNRKIDYNLLKEIHSHEKIDYTAPKNEVEKRLTELWGEILGLPRVGIRNNFFNLGGNSLNFMTLISRIHKIFDVRISLRETFNNPTIEKQAEIIMNSPKYRHESIRNSEKKEYYRLSSAQKRVYIIQQADERNLSYNILRRFRLKGDIDKKMLEEALKKLIQRHENLRTSFEVIGSEPVQKIWDKIEFKIQYMTLDSEDRLDEIAKNFIKPFDLSQPPLMRAGLIQIGEKDYAFVYDTHHIITDGTSQEIFEQELMMVYGGRELPQLKLQYRDYSEWQNNNLRIDTNRQQEKYWLKEFGSGTPVLNIPTDFERPPVQSFEGHAISFELEKDETEGLQGLAKEENATLYMVILALFYIWLSKLSGQEDIIVGADTAGRIHSDLEPIIGMFVNTLPLRNCPTRDRVFRDFLREVKMRTLEAFENQDCPFDDIVDRLQVKKERNRNPMFDVMFSFLNFEKKKEIPDNVSRLRLQLYGYESTSSKFDMNMKVKLLDHLIIIVEYCTHLFTQSTIERYIKYFREIVSSVLSNSNTKIEEIKIVSSNTQQVKPDMNQIDLDF
jgi:amino acid adenylation domain-containing protein